MKTNPTDDKDAGKRLQEYWAKLGRFAGPTARLASQQLEREKSKLDVNKPVASASFE
jgi:hypothetical protein